MNRCILSLLFFAAVAVHATDLSIETKTIKVNGKEAKVLSIAQPDGTLGVRIKKDDPFDVTLKNTMDVPTSIHWHGLVLPNGQDGVAFITKYAIYPGLSYHYQFPLVQSGTYWMHSHYGLQEQKQLSAPLIITDADDASIANQDAILLLADFSFKTPTEIYQNLRCPKKKKGCGPKWIWDLKISSTWDYDAFLTNYRTLEDPEIVKVEPGKKVRLRIIERIERSNFFVRLGTLEGELILRMGIEWIH